MPPALIVISLLVLLFVLRLAYEPALVQWRRQRVRRQPFPDAWRDILKRRVPLFRALPADLQLQLKKHIQVFLAEKEFIGCRGQAITDEVRVTIAAQACLLLLNRHTHYFPGLRQILVYPGAFIVDRKHMDYDGVLQEQRQVLEGESWEQGQVILSWQDTLEGAAVADDGRNLVIHEFAHQLDQENGEANGAPPMAGRRHYKRWSQVMYREYRQLKRARGLNVDTLLDKYGATSPAEFFAVISETFFEQPGPLAGQHPALYEELSRYYRVNPLSWH
jgi:Mlc titration factor MtfA (ptsG expression regulator)